MAVVVEGNWGGSRAAVFHMLDMVQGTADLVVAASGIKVTPAHSCRRQDKKVPISRFITCSTPLHVAHNLHSGHFTMSPSPPVSASPDLPPEEDDGAADLPMTMAASVVLDHLPRDAHQALETAGLLEQAKGRLYLPG